MKFLKPIAVIKSWIKSGSDRGLERAKEILRALANNVVNSKQARKKKSTIEKISDWGSSLFGDVDTMEQQTRLFKDGNSKSIASQQLSNCNQSQNDLPTNGMASRLNRLHTPAQVRENQTTLQKEREESSQHVMNRIAIGFGSRMALMNAATLERRNSNINAHTIGSQNEHQKLSHGVRRGRQDVPNDATLQPFGPLLFIEPRVLPNAMTFKLVIDGMFLMIAALLQSSIDFN